MRYLARKEAIRRLEQRLGESHARRRLAMENAPPAGRRSEDLLLSPGFITGVLRLSGMLERGRANARRVELVRNVIRSPALPSAFDGFTILQLSDLHADGDPQTMINLARLIEGLDYDLCVMTGDYRGPTFGDYHPCLDALQPVREAIRAQTYAVLGNHDTILMAPDMEAWGIRFLLNESLRLDRGGESIFLAGVEDPHFLRTADVAKAAADLPAGAFSILLAHTPEIYREAASHRFDLLLAGHTHGGQICLPGGVPLTLDMAAPRFLGRGAWSHGDMAGYTSAGVGASIAPVRFNCPPEATLHCLRKA